MFTDVILPSVSTLAVLISAYFLYRTIRSNQNMNRQILFGNITKEERELKIKFQEYWERMDDKNLSESKKESIRFAYETLLFNFYECLAICLHEKLINERETKLYFRDLLKGVKRFFDDALIFEKEFAKKEEYKGIQWLFKRWNIEH